MIDQLQALDTQWFTAVNSVHGAWADVLMTLLTHQLSWTLPLVAVLVMCRRVGWRQTTLLVAAIGLTVLLADQISSGLIKHLVERPRPSHTPSLEATIHIVNGYRGGPYGFVSSHAANSLGVCLLLALILRHRAATVALLVWTALQCYSRVYLGVHYPGDIAGGLLVGAVVAVVVYRLWLVAQRRWSDRLGGNPFTASHGRLVAWAFFVNVLFLMVLATILILW